MIRSLELDAIPAVEYSDLLPLDMWVHIIAYATDIVKKSGYKLTRCKSWHTLLCDYTLLSKKFMTVVESIFPLIIHYYTKLPIPTNVREKFIGLKRLVLDITKHDQSPFPSNINKWSLLEKLTVQNMKTLPNEIQHLSNLKKLKLKPMVDETDLTKLVRLNNLEVILDFWSNKERVLNLPTSITTLTINTLTNLNITSITLDLPGIEQALNNLPNLTELYILEPGPSLVNKLPLHKNLKVLSVTMYSAMDSNLLDGMSHLGELTLVQLDSSSKRQDISPSILKSMTSLKRLFLRSTIEHSFLQNIKLLENLVVLSLDFDREECDLLFLMDMKKLEYLSLNYNLGECDYFHNDINLPSNLKTLFMYISRVTWNGRTLIVPVWRNGVTHQLSFPNLISTKRLNF